MRRVIVSVHFLGVVKRQREDKQGEESATAPATAKPVADDGKNGQKEGKGRDSGRTDSN